MNTTHNPAFIEEMKQLLLTEQQTLLGELKATAKLLDGTWVVDFPEYGEDRESNALEIDEATGRAAVVQADAERLKEVELALQKIADGTYGLTNDGAVISEERLRANPAATTIIE